MHRIFFGRRLLMLTVLAGFCGGAAAAESVDWAPLFSHDIDVAGADRLRILGPVFESRTATNGASMWAARPVISVAQLEDEEDRYESAVLWPLWIGTHLNDESYWVGCGLTFWHNYDVTNPRPRYSFWAIPFYFQGRDAGGTNYWAVLPFGGTIREFIGRDEISFVLFPLTYYDRINEVRTRAALWPLISRTQGGGHDRFRFFPFYGYSSLRDEFTKQFVLWPFWTSVRYAPPQSPGFGYILFPLWGHIRLADQVTWYFLPPFIRFSSGAKESKIHAPYPFFQKYSGPTEKLYFWPVWGYKSMPDYSSAFLFWPIGLSNRRQTAQGERHTVKIVPIVYSETHTRKSAAAGAVPEVFFRQFKTWPLFSYKRLEDRSRFVFPSLVPYKDFAIVDRHYAPLWTLYARSRCGATVEHEVLWGWFQYRHNAAGLVRTSLFPLYDVERDVEAEAYEWSILKGLIGYERQAGRRVFRFLYLPVWRQGA